MSSVTVKIDGAERINRALLSLPDRLATNTLRASVAAGAATIRDEARALAPLYIGDEIARKHPPAGTLKRSILSKYIKEQSTYYRATYYVVVRRGKKYRNQGKGGNLSQDAYYWWFVENGYFQVGRAAKGAKSNANKNRRMAYGTQKGAFVPGKNFMRGAFMRKRNEALNSIMDKLRAGIAKHAGSA